MNFRQELAEGIITKYFGAIGALRKRNIDLELIRGKGCVVVAWDGFLRGGLAQDVYTAHLRELAKKRIFPRGWVIEGALKIPRIFKDVLGERCPPNVGVRLYSSSPKATETPGLTPRVLSRREALTLAEDVRRGRTLGVLIDTKVKGHNHLLSLIGENGGIFRVDGATRACVSCLTNREAANLMRRGQRHGGLVIDIR